MLPNHSKAQRALKKYYYGREATTASREFCPASTKIENKYLGNIEKLQQPAQIHISRGTNPDLVEAEGFFQAWKFPTVLGCPLSCDSDDN